MQNDEPGCGSLLAPTAKNKSFSQCFYDFLEEESFEENDIDLTIFNINEYETTYQI